MIIKFSNKKIFLLGFFILVLGCGFGLANKAEAATNVYYSVGQNITDHKTCIASDCVVNPLTVTISGGVATFSTPQTATNLGVGDAVTYNTNVVAYISGKQSTSIWTLVTALGAPAPDITGSTVVSITHAFAGLNNVFNGTPNASDASHINSTSLVTKNVILNIPLYYDTGSDTAAVTGIVFTTDATRYIRIYTPTSTTAEVNQNQRHQGVWNTSKYILAVTDANVLTLNKSNVYIDGLQVQEVSNTATRYGVYMSNTNQNISNSIIQGPGGSVNFGGIRIIGGPVNIWNNIIYNVGTGGSAMGISFSANSSANIYSNTIISGSNGYGIDLPTGTNTVVLKNNYAKAPAGYAYHGTWTTMTTSASSDTTGSTGLQNITINTTNFTNVTAGSEDFHIPLASALKGTGTDTSGDATPLNFTVDIDGQTRSAPWDIGADQSQASDLTAPTIDTFTIPAITNSLTITVSFAAHDNVAVTGYMITESSSAPAAGDAGWLVSAPTSYTISGPFASKTLYAWAKDAAGNVSSGLNATILFDNTAPTITGFVIPSTATSLTVPITTFTATDANGVTGYMATTTSSAPSASDLTWQGTAPTSYTFSSAGSHTLYAWTKDAAGNVSLSSNGTVNITLSYYVTAGGTGSKDGSDWNSAYDGLPLSFVCGATYYLAGGTYDYTSKSTTISNSCSSDLPIVIYKAISGGPGNPQNVAGWQASYGTSQALFTQTTDPDPELQYPSLFIISGTYITFDGIIPSSGTPTKSSAYGIKLQSSNDIRNGFISVTGANNTIKHLEMDGITPHYGYQVIGCSRSGNTVTVTTNGNPPWVVGDKVDLYMNGGTPTSFTTVAPSTGWVITSISGNQIQYSQSGSDETCTSVTASTLVLNYTFPTSLTVNISANPGNFTFTDNYLHDIAGGISNTGTGGGCNNCTYLRNYHARNHSTATQHQNAFDGATFNNSVIGQSIFEDISGTSIATPTCGGSCNWQNDVIYSNLSFCTAGSVSNYSTSWEAPQCGTSSIFSDDNGSNQATNMLIYGNTIIRPTACKIYFNHAGSSATVENNLLYCSNTNNSQSAWSPNLSITVGSGSHDYNTVWNSNYQTSPSSHDNFINTLSFPNIFTDPSDIVENFRLLSESIDSGSCTPGTNCLKDGASLSSPYDIDLAGATRGADGTWERGAYEKSVSSAKVISAFNFTSPSATGSINEGAKTIALTVPFGTNVTALVPTITISGSSVAPLSEVAQDFTSPVHYIVTAEDATTADYTVTVTVAASLGLPTAASVTVSGTKTVGQTLTGSYTFSDPNSLPESGTTYEWQRSSVSIGSYSAIGGATATTYILTSADIGQYLKFQVTPRSASGTGSPGLSSATTQIQSSGVPTVSAVSISGTVTEGQTLTGNYTYAQADSAAQGISTFRWLSSDTSGGVYSAIGGATANTYSLAPADVGKYIKFEVTPVAIYPPTTGSAVTSSNVGPVVASSLPVASAVDYTGTETVGHTLTGVYTYSDSGSHAQAVSTFRWLESSTQNGTYSVIPSATAQTYTLVAGDIGKYLKFEVTPVSTVATGVVVASGPSDQINSSAVPIASAVAISGTPAIGQVLTGSYTYSQADSVAQGVSTFRWLSSSTSGGTYSAIGGATNSTYPVVTADQGMYIKFEVTPVATVPPTTGLAVLSSATTQVPLSTQILGPSGGGGLITDYAPPVVTPTITALLTNAPFTPKNGQGGEVKSSTPLPTREPRSVSGGVSNFGATTIKQGSKGGAVKELQKFLNQDMNLKLKVDGIAGKNTIAIVKKWQKMHGLVVDGIVGPMTKKMMGSGK